MKNKCSIKNMTLTAVCIALCVVLPIAFHSIPDAGSVFLPMHIPVLICGMICGWPYGFICGLMGPLVSSALTGMPPIAILPAMMLECGTPCDVRCCQGADFHARHVHDRLDHCQLHYRTARYSDSAGVPALCGPDSDEGENHSCPLYQG